MAVMGRFGGLGGEIALKTRPNGGLTYVNMRGPNDSLTAKQVNWGEM